LEAEIEKVKRETMANVREAETEVEKVKMEAVAKILEAEADAFVVRSKVKQEPRILNAKVRDLEASLVMARVDQEMMMLFKRWTGKVVCSKY
jgi:hypothetical protein